MIKLAKKRGVKLFVRSLPAVGPVLVFIAGVCTGSTASAAMIEAGAPIDPELLKELGEAATEAGYEFFDEPHLRRLYNYNLTLFENEEKAWEMTMRDWQPILDARKEENKCGCTKK